jgi:hypothetical protein
MKISHKPFKSKNPKGLHQKKITHFKSREEYSKEIRELEIRRSNYYSDLVKELQSLELEYKRNKTSNEYRLPNNKKGIDEKYIIQKAHAVKTYNELVRPIDAQLKVLRLEIYKKYPVNYKNIDNRLDYQKLKNL